MSLVQTSAPAIEPTTLADAALFMQVIDSADDAVITLLLGAARRYAESYCRRSFITQQWRLTLDAFPCDEIELEMSPVQSVQSIVYRDMGGVQQTISSPALPAWAMDLYDDKARIAPGFGYTWPDALPQIGAVQVNYTAGYGDLASDVPEGIRHWILMRTKTIFENREDVAVMQRGSVSALPYVDRLLDPYVVLRA